MSKIQTTEKLLIIAINYKSEFDTFEFIRQLAQQTAKQNIYFVVVNNKQSEDYDKDFNEEVVKIGIENGIDCTCFNPTENLGYLNGCLYGIQEFQKEQYLPDWIHITNTDISFNNPAVLESFLSAKYEDNVWMVAPCIQNINGFYHNPYYKKRLSKCKINRIIAINKFACTRWIYGALGQIRLKKKIGVRESSCYVYAAHGSSFMLKKEMLENMSNETFCSFLYGEENFLAEIAREHNKLVYYDSNLSLIHFANATTSQLTTKKRALYLQESLRFIKNRFYK